jgi:hypothetical protein
VNEYVQKKIIFWTFALVLALGLIEVRLFLIPPSTVLKAQNIASKSRLPAAVIGRMPPQSNVVLDQANEILDFQIPCKRKLTEFSAAGSRQIRFHFKKCSKDSEDLKIEAIINQANLYDATIFTIGDDEQSSDFIPLKAGANRFLIVMSDEDHEKIQIQYIFNRPLLNAAQK